MAPSVVPIKHATSRAIISIILTEQNIEWLTFLHMNMSNMYRNDISIINTETEAQHNKWQILSTDYQKYQNTLSIVNLYQNEGT